MIEAKRDKEVEELKMKKHHRNVRNSQTIRPEQVFGEQEDMRKQTKTICKVSERLSMNENNARLKWQTKRNILNQKRTRPFLKF